MTIGKIGHNLTVQLTSCDLASESHVNKRDDPNRVNQATAAIRDLSMSIARRLYELSRGLKYLDAQLVMLSFGLSKATLANLWQKQEELKNLAELLNYYGYEIRDIKKLTSEDQIDKAYIYRLGGLKITKDDISKSMDDLKQELDKRCSELAQLQVIEDRLYILETATAASEPMGIDAELQIIIVKLANLGKISDIYGEKRRELMLRAQTIYHP